MKTRTLARRERQQGIVLVLIVLVLLAIGGVVLLTGLTAGNTTSRRLAEGANADQRLLAARDALIGYAAGNIADTGRPGQLPAPDTLDNGNYDGTTVNASCLDGTKVNGLPALTSDSADLRCIGRLPWKTLGITADGVDEYDATGIVPWYAVSANLSANTSALTYLNPATIAATPVSFTNPSDTAPPYPWLKVCDQTGKLLSDRVAFVLIVPGLPVDTVGRTQLRSGSPRPQPADYLDAIPVPAGWGALPAAQRCTTYDNAALSNEFVTAETASGFNDRLLYVTVDELMARVETRVAHQVREALIVYQGNSLQANPHRYPWLAPIGNPTSITDAFIAVSGTNAGLVPFHTTTPGQRFKTELNYTIGTAFADSVVPATNYTTPFLCFGGTYQCRLRTSPATGLIPRTVTAAQFLALKTGTVATPLVQCAFSTINALDCDAYSYTQIQAVTYNVQRRPCCSGAYTLYGTYAGTQTRTITILPSGLQASGAAVFSADGASFVRRSLTTSAATGAGMLNAVDRWVPAGAGAAPFDTASSFQTGSATTNNNVITVSNIRVYPQLPRWYVGHKWYEFIYAAISPDASSSVGGNSCGANCFTAGAHGSVHAVVISSGKMINTQNRYSPIPAVADFLEAPNDTGTATRVFSDPATSATANYADTVVTIPR